jgi:hypothetical protein
MTSAVLPVGGHDTLMMLVTALTWGMVIIVVVAAGPAHLSRTQSVERTPGQRFHPQEAGAQCPGALSCTGTLFSLCGYR